MSKAEQTRAFIIEKTAPLFNTKGYEGTSMNDMVQATGLTKGSIYGNFANKDEVALAVFDHNLQQIDSIIRSEMSGRKSNRNKLMVYVEVYDNFAGCLPEGGCPILNTATEADDTHPALRKKAHNAVNNWKNKIIAIIHEGIRVKEFNSKINAEETALAMIATIEGAIMLTKLTGKTAYRKTILQTVKATIQQL
ncbi:MAG: TetR/AcrR family transcriptional regulator [Rhizobacter sp.]|nr:TetR/AcrR family transcriptional regulator [Ferruginibacter sp.]